MSLWLFNCLLRLLAQGSGLGGCCGIALLWQQQRKHWNLPFQWIACVQYAAWNLSWILSLCIQMETEDFFFLYFHRLLYIQIIGTCRYIMLQTEQYKQVHVGIHRVTKARIASKGLTFLPRQ